jgi:hypothetical protein
MSSFLKRQNHRDFRPRFETANSIALLFKFDYRMRGGYSSRYLLETKGQNVYKLILTTKVSFGVHVIKRSAILR